VGSVDIGSVAFEFAPVESQGTIWRTVSALERLTAAVLLILTFPILLLASIAVIALSRRSPFVAHQRVGRGGRLIWVLKLRTMWKGDTGRRSILVHRLSVAESLPLTPDTKNVRVTSRFAAFCRRYSLDELPQLWHVVRGEMSLVGPRPLTREELDVHYGVQAVRVISRKPGLSGLWQISGRSRLTYPQRRRLDLFLIEKWSIPLYFRILLLTFPRVLAGKDAW
jgi:lipopolysaccharide/colanic/teichoic acid biosynthesis glycosyltransferase